MSLDDYNYLNDFRNRPGGPTSIYVEQPDGSYLEEELPTRWAVCSVCNGEGKHVNPSIDCEGILASDFSEDPGFAEEYFGGTYDVTCHRCKGRTTERVVDVEALTDDQRQAYDEAVKEEADARAMELAEIRMGA